jgi:hypothetical protein
LAGDDDILTIARICPFVISFILSFLNMYRPSLTVLTISLIALFSYQTEARVKACSALSKPNCQSHPHCIWNGDNGHRSCRLKPEVQKNCEMLGVDSTDQYPYYCERDENTLGINIIFPDPITGADGKQVAKHGCRQKFCMCDEGWNKVFCYR